MFGIKRNEGSHAALAAASLCVWRRMRLLLAIPWLLVLAVVGLLFYSLEQQVGAATEGTPVCGPIVADTTWSQAGSPYLVCDTYSATVAQGVTLTIEPGVEIQFEANGRLEVEGTLTAIGTVTGPITFTGMLPSPGSWQGLTIAGSPGTLNTGSALSFVTIEYGGTGSGNSANLFLEYAEVTISHSTFRNGAKHGLHAWTDAVAHISDSGFFDNGPANAGYAVLYSDGRVEPLLARLTAVGNGVDAVGLGGHAYLEGEREWAEMGLPYIVLGGVTVMEDATLTIEPGVEVQFEHFESLNVVGRLNALGLPTRPITFTGTAKSPGWWDGIAISGSAGAPATALFDYVTAEYGGSGTANLYLSNGQMAFQHGIIRASGRHGVWANGGTRITIEASQVVSNTDYGIFNASLAEADVVNAANNWWGSATGPQVDGGCNPGGSGSRVTPGSVIFRPFLSAADQEIPPGPVPGDALVLTLRPHRWFVPADGSTRIWFTITLRDGKGDPVPGRMVVLSTSSAAVSPVITTDIRGQALAYASSDQVGDADVRVELYDKGSCEFVQNASTTVAFIATDSPDLLSGSQAPYFSDDLQVDPQPVVRGVPTTISVELANPNAFAIGVDVTFSFASAHIGLPFLPVGEVAGTVITAHSTATVETVWVPAVSGYYCLQVEYVAYPATGVQMLSDGTNRQRLNLKTYSGPLGSPSEKESLAKARKAIGIVNKFTGGKTSKPFNVPKKGVLFLTDWQLGQAADISKQMVGDPPRQDYRSLIVPPKPAFTPLQPDDDISAAQAVALNALAGSLRDVVFFGRAATISLDRYGGAAVDGDLEWSSIQSGALIYYKEQLGAALIGTALRLEEFRQVLLDEGVPDAVVTIEDVIAYQERLQTQGFTADEIDAARSLGLDDEEIEAERLQRIAADPQDGTGSSHTYLAELAAAFRALGTILTTPRNFGLSVSGGSGAPLASEGPVHSLVTLFETKTLIPVGNPLPETATLDLRLRPIDLPAGWMVAVSPRQAILAPGEQITATVSLIPAPSTVQGAVPRVAVEGYIGEDLIGGVVVDVVVPSYRPFDLESRAYLPLILR